MVPVLSFPCRSGESLVSCLGRLLPAGLLTAMLSDLRVVGVSVGSWPSPAAVLLRLEDTVPTRTAGGARLPHGRASAPCGRTRSVGARVQTVGTFTAFGGSVLWFSSPLSLPERTALTSLLSLWDGLFLPLILRFCLMYLEVPVVHSCSCSVSC